MIMTTENIIKPEEKRQFPVHEPSTERSTLKKGQRVKVWENPLVPTGTGLGVGTLTKCNDTKVYHAHPGFENWNVKLEYEDQSSPRIVHARDIVPD